MAAEIELPDGTRAIYDGNWQCPDPKAIPMLEYLTVRILNEMQYEPNYHHYVARKIAAIIVGSRVIRVDPNVHPRDKKGVIF